MFDISPEELRFGLILYILLVACLCLRAYGQAWMAHWLGDDTPRAEGRLTMNPLPHMDVLGSVVLPLLCIFYFQPATRISFFMAWTKPVPINASHFANPRRGFLLTQLASPLMSLLCALVATLIEAAIQRQSPMTADVFKNLTVINASLVVIDFLPLPPLPGGLILRHLGLISEAMFWSISRWSGLALIILFNIPVFQSYFYFLVNLVYLPFYMLLHRLT